MPPTTSIRPRFARPYIALGLLLAFPAAIACQSDGDERVGGDAPTGGGSTSTATGTEPGSDTTTTATGTHNTGPAAVQTQACEEPVAWSLPTREAVVGSGTAASCTEHALRSALEAGGHVSFSCGTEPVTIRLLAPITVREATVLDGKNLVTLDGQGENQLLLAATGSKLSVRNLRFIGGKAADTMDPEGIGGAVAGQWRSEVEVIGCTFEDNRAARGGGAVAVWTGSRLTVTRSQFRRNHSWYGGAIYSLLSPLTVVNSDFIDNSTVVDGGLGDGGAIGTDGASESPDDALGGAVEICGSNFTGNLAYGQGGAAYIWVYPPDTVLIDRTTIADNAVEKNERGAAFGGGMRISNGEITVRRSTLTANTSVGNGGGLYLDCAPSCKLVNSTFHKNHSDTYGGAVFGDGATLSNVTLAENSAGGHGGALFGGKLTLHNSLFVNNSTGNPWGQARNCSKEAAGDHVLQWYEPSSDSGGDLCIPDPISADPFLSSLADHGGSTPTLLPGSASAALDAGSNCESEDQRGEPRAIARCDIGAVEVP